MNGADFRKIRAYLRKEEEKITNDITEEIDKLELPEKAAISEQIWLKKNIAADLDRLDTIRNNYKTISELYFIELEEKGVEA